MISESDRGASALVREIIRDWAGRCRRRPEAVEPRLVDAFRLVRDDAVLADSAHDFHDPEAGDLQAWGDLVKTRARTIPS